LVFGPLRAEANDVHTPPLPHSIIFRNIHICYETSPLSGEVTLRQVNDSLRGGQNRVFAASEDPWLGSLSVGAGACKLRQPQYLSRKVRLMQFDHKQAYKQFPAKWRDVLHNIFISMKPKANTAQCWLNLALILGTKGSVWEYCWVSICLCVVLCRPLGVVCCGCVDDYILINQQPCSKEVFHTSVQIQRWLGLKVKICKNVHPTQVGFVFGLDLVMRDGCGTGKMSYPTTVVAGKVGRACMHSVWKT